MELAGYPTAGRGAGSGAGSGLLPACFLPPCCSLGPGSPAPSVCVALQDALLELEGDLPLDRAGVACDELFRDWKHDFGPVTKKALSFLSLLVFLVSRSCWNPYILRSVTSGFTNGRPGVQVDTECRHTSAVGFGSTSEAVPSGTGASSCV